VVLKLRNLLIASLQVVISCHQRCLRLYENRPRLQWSRHHTITLISHVSSIWCAWARYGTANCSCFSGHWTCLMRAVAEDDNSEERAILCESGGSAWCLWFAS